MPPKLPAGSGAATASLVQQRVVPDALVQSLRLQPSSDSCLLQVIAPTVNAYLYTWAGYRTAEGEFLPVRVEAIELGSIAGMLLLPTVVEHTIDERSPLYGHTHDSLVVSRDRCQRDPALCMLLLPFAVEDSAGKASHVSVCQLVGSERCLAMGCTQQLVAAALCSEHVAVLSCTHYMRESLGACFCCRLCRPRLL